VYDNECGSNEMIIDSKNISLKKRKIKTRVKTLNKN
jgi:hypothetical protein